MNSGRLRAKVRGARDVAALPMTNIWDEVLARIDTKVNRHSFYTWFKPTAYVATRAGGSSSGCRTSCSATG